jgi:hypothetical protein
MLNAERLLAIFELLLLVRTRKVSEKTAVAHRGIRVKRLAFGVQLSAFSFN